LTAAETGCHRKRMYQSNHI